MTMKPIVDRALLLLKQRQGDVFDGCMAVGGVAMIAFGGTSTTELVGAGMGVAGFADWARKFVGKRGKAQKTRIVENIEYGDALAGCALPDGFAVHGGRLRRDGGRPLVQADLADIDHIDHERPWVTSPAVNAQLDGGRNPLQILTGAYRLPEEFAEHVERCVNLKRPHTNDLKIRLISDVDAPLLASGRAVTVQTTRYFDSVVTNEMACSQFMLADDDYQGPPRPLMAVADFVVSGRRLVPLAESRLSNHIGVSTLLLSADDQLILQDQGDQLVASNETAVGASGSLDGADLRAGGHDGSLQGLCRFGMEREANEELGARFAPQGQATVLVGYARYLARGAKPEFFGISRTLSRRDEMRPRPSERFVSGIRGLAFMPSRSGLAAVIDRLLNDGIERRLYSLSMIANLRLARDWLDNADAAALARLGLSRD